MQANKENWEKIKSESILFGMRNAPSRCTYLATTKKIANKFGNIILEVKYDPLKNKKMNNYDKNCWQFRVYEPIEIKNIKKL